MVVGRYSLFTLIFQYIQSKVVKLKCEEKLLSAIFYFFTLVFQRIRLKTVKKMCQHPVFYWSVTEPLSKRLSNSAQLVWGVIRSSLLCLTRMVNKISAEFRGISKVLDAEKEEEKRKVSRGQGHGVRGQGGQGYPQLPSLSHPNGQQDLCRVQGNL